MDEITMRAVGMLACASAKARQRGDARPEGEPAGPGAPVTAERVIEAGITIADLAVILREREIRAMPPAERARLIQEAMAAIAAETEAESEAR